MSLIHKFKYDNEFYIIDVNSGAVHVVDELVYDMIQEKREEKQEIVNRLEGKYSKEEVLEAFEDVEYLINEGILYSEDLYENIALNDKSKSFVKAMCLNVAHDCNLRCKYCFAEEGEYKKGHRTLMTAETGKKAVDFVIRNSGPRKNIEIDLFGGEPLMAFDTIKEIVDYAREVEGKYNKNIRFTITTNSTLLNDENMDYIDKQMGNVVLSIDGRKSVNDKIRTRRDGSGSYDSILPKIKSMVDRRDKSKQYYVRGTFTRENLDFYEDVIALANEGFKEISIEPVVLPDEHELSLRKEDLQTIYKSYDKLYEEMVRRHEAGDGFKFYHFNIDLNGGPCVYKRISGCGAGHEYVAVSADGDLYPCHQFIGNDDFKLGTVDSETIDQTLATTFKDAHIYNKPTCKNCWARFYCSGGCQANNYNFNNDIHVPYEMACELLKKRVECAIALKNKIK